MSNISLKNQTPIATNKQSSTAARQSAAEGQRDKKRDKWMKNNRTDEEQNEYNKNQKDFEKEINENFSQDEDAAIENSSAAENNNNNNDKNDKETSATENEKFKFTTTQAHFVQTFLAAVICHENGDAIGRERLNEISKILEEDLNSLLEANKNNEKRSRE